MSKEENSVPRGDTKIEENRTPSTLVSFQKEQALYKQRGIFLDELE
jgi:hypothetical protein